jgi:fucose permease
VQEVINKSDQKLETKAGGGLQAQIALAFAAFIMIGAAEGAVGVLLPSIQNFYNIDKSVVGAFFLFSTTGYLTVAILSGWLVEKLGLRGFLMLGVSGFLLSVGLISAKPPLLLLLGALFLFGFGIAVVDAGLNAYIAGFPNNTAVLNNLHAFYGIGALSGPFIAAIFLEVKFEWNTVYWLWAAFSIIILLGIRTFYRSNIVQPSDTESGTDKEKEKTSIFVTLKLRIVWLGAIYLLFYVGGEVSIGNWGYSYLTEQRNEIPLFAGWMVSGYWLGLTVSRLITARLAAHWQISDKRMIQLCLVGVFIGIATLALVPVGIGAAFGLALIGFGFGPLFPTTIALMSRMVAPRLLPNAVGFLASMASVGAAFWPWLLGNLAQGVGLWVLPPYVAAISLLMVVVWQSLIRER